MGRVADDMARVARDIAGSRRERSKLATEIKTATRRRHGAVEAHLKEAKAARCAATSAQAAAGERLRGDLRTEARSMLRGFKATRLRATGDYRREAIATTTARQRDVKSMLHGFAREGVVRSRQRQENAEAQHEQSAMFRKNLVNSVDAFRDKLARDGRDRAAETRGNLASYANDRREGMAVWTRTLRQTPQVRKQPQAAPAEATGQSQPVEAMERKATFAATGRQDKAKIRQPALNQRGRQKGQAK